MLPLYPRQDLNMNFHVSQTRHFFTANCLSDRTWKQHERGGAFVLTSERAGPRAGLAEHTLSGDIHYPGKES